MKQTLLESVYGRRLFDRVRRSFWTACYTRGWVHTFECSLWNQCDRLAYVFINKNFVAIHGSPERRIRKDGVSGRLERPKPSNDCRRSTGRALCPIPTNHACQQSCFIKDSQIINLTVILKPACLLWFVSSAFCPYCCYISRLILKHGKFFWVIQCHVFAVQKCNGDKFWSNLLLPLFLSKLFCCFSIVFLFCQRIHAVGIVCFMCIHQTIIWIVHFCCSSL